MCVSEPRLSGDNQCGSQGQVAFVMIGFPYGLHGDDGQKKNRCTRTMFPIALEEIDTAESAGSILSIVLVPMHALRFLMFDFIEKSCLG